MKRIVQTLASALVVILSALPADSLSITASIATVLSEALEAAKIHTVRNPRFTADFVISAVNQGTVEAFSSAWRRSGNGTSPREGVVLILRMVDGGYKGIDIGSTNEHKQFTFRWHPATIAIVHTHPNSSDPLPQHDDIAVADKYQIPIFTITSRGMYVYEPQSKKISKVMSNLDWLNFSNWERGLALDGKQLVRSQTR